MISRRPAPDVGRPESCRSTANKLHGSRSSFIAVAVVGVAYLRASDPMARSGLRGLPNRHRRLPKGRCGSRITPGDPVDGAQSESCDERLGLPIREQPHVVHDLPREHLVPPARRTPAPQAVPEQRLLRRGPRLRRVPAMVPRLEPFRELEGEARYPLGRRLRKFKKARAESETSGNVHIPS